MMTIIVRYKRHGTDDKSETHQIDYINDEKNTHAQEEINVLSYI